MKDLTPLAPSLKESSFFILIFGAKMSDGGVNLASEILPNNFRQNLNRIINSVPHIVHLAKTLLAVAAGLSPLR